MYLWILILIVLNSLSRLSDRESDLHWRGFPKARLIIIWYINYDVKWKVYMVRCLKIAIIMTRFQLPWKIITQIKYDFLIFQDFITFNWIERYFENVFHFFSIPQGPFGFSLWNLVYLNSMIFRCQPIHTAHTDWYLDDKTFLFIGI